MTEIEWKEWRENPATQVLLVELQDEANKHVGTILNSQTADIQRDQYLKGFISGLSYAVGFRPEFDSEKGPQVVEGEFMGAE